MMPMLLLLGMGLPMERSSVFCGRDAYKQTPLVRDAAGVAVSLWLHDEDDHGKNTHLCQSEYELQIVRADGSMTSTGFDNGNDADWDRRIEFGVEGFSADDQRAVAMIVEDGRYPVVQVLLFEVQTQDYTAVSLEGAFIRSLGSACVRALYVKGFTAQDEVVIGTGDVPLCGQQRLWRVTKRKTRMGTNVTEMLPRAAAVMPLVKPAAVHEAPR